VKKFTILELLIIMAIIGILISLLLPSVTRAREKTKRAVCKSNTHNLYVGALSFSIDNNGEFPNGGDPILERFIWTAHGGYQYVFIKNMIPYWGGKVNPRTWPAILRCPSNSALRTSSSSDLSQTTHYIYTGNFHGNHGYVMREGLKENLRMSQHDDPTKVTVFADRNVRQSANAKVNHSVDYGNKYSSGVITPYVAGGNRNTLAGATQWKYPTAMGWDNVTRKDTSMNESNRKAQAGPFYYWW
jgi:type II secretory pathway pseudopilin PulG